MESLGEREEQLEKRKELLEKRIVQEVEKAKEFTRQKKKQQAMMCLKKKKMYESQVDQMENLILRVNEQKIMLENQRTTAEVISSMKNASEAAKDTMKQMKIENVDQVMDEINEQTDEMKQVYDAFSTPTGLAADLDDDALLEELDNLENEELDEELLAPAPVPVAVKIPDQPLPSVPHKEATAAVQPKTQEELELEALEAEMAA